MTCDRLVLKSGRKIKEPRRAKIFLKEKINLGECYKKCQKGIPRW
jgi:hypothetical protein